MWAHMLKNNSLCGWGGGCVGEEVRVFGSDEERGEGIVFYYMWAHMTYLTWKKVNPRGRHMGRLTVKRD